MKGVPRNLDPDETIQVRASVDSVYAQIASDLKFCIDNMPSVGYHDLEPGHATKWAAEALMARVFLFYNGQAYGRTYSSTSATMPLAEGGNITNAQVVSWVDDVLAVYQADTDSGDGVVEWNVRKVKSARGSGYRDNIGVIFSIR